MFVAALNPVLRRVSVIEYPPEMLLIVWEVIARDVNGIVKSAGLLVALATPVPTTVTAAEPAAET
jgi:hypothetical protein